MADQTYSVQLDDEVSPGLLRIIHLLDKMEKKMNTSTKLPKSLDKTDKTIKKVSKTTDKSVKSFQKLDTVLNMFSQPIGQIAGKFGMIGDALEGSSGKMIGMGGAAAGAGVAILGVAAGAAVVAGAVYGMGKAALFANEVFSSHNKAITTVRGNLGKYISKTDEVIKQSMKINVNMGRPYLEVANDLALAVKAGNDLKTATDFVTLKNSMTGFGDAGKNVNDVLDQIVKGNKFEPTLKDMQKVKNAMDALGVKGIKPLQLIKEKDSKKQLAMMLSNKEGLERLKKSAEKSVPAMDRLKTAFSNMFAKAIGGNGKDPLGDSINKIIAWTEDENNIKRIKTFFASMGEAFNKSMNKAPAVLDKIMQIINGMLRLLKLLGVIEDRGNAFQVPTPISKATEAGKAVEKAKKPISEIKGLTQDAQGRPIYTPPAATTQTSINKTPTLKLNRIIINKEQPIQVEQPTSSLQEKYNKAFDEKTASNDTNITNANKATVNIYTSDRELAMTVKQLMHEEFKDMSYQIGA